MQRTWVLPVLALALFVIALLVPSTGVRIRLRNHMMQMPPVDLAFTVSVSSHPDNRQLEMVAWCGEMDLQHSSIPIAGDHDSIQHRISWTLGEPCDYRITADLFGVNDRHEHDEIEFVVLDPTR